MRFHLFASALGILVLFACTSDNTTSSPTVDLPDGGSPEAGVGTGLGPTGQFFGPVGAQLGITLGAETVTPSIAAASPPAAGYGSTPFAFQQALAAGPYRATAGTAPTNQTCAIYRGASGTAPIAADALRAGCEWTFDLVSRSTDDAVTTGADHSNHPAIGGLPADGDGRFVAFTSNEPGLAGSATTTTLHIYWRDRLTGETRLVSKGPDGKEGDGRSEQPAISADGYTVAFRSDSTNLVTGDNNGVSDVFVWKIDRATHAETLVRGSVGSAGEEANAPSEAPTLSGDGGILAFTTGATNVAAGQNDSTLNDKVVRRDLATGTNTLVTRRPNGDAASGGYPMLSEDGNRLVYWAYANVNGDLAPDIWDMFVYEKSTDRNWPVTLAPDGSVKNQGDESVSGGIAPAISGDGKWVAYSTTATNLAPGFDNRKVHAYVVEVDHCTASGCNVKPIDQTPTGTQSDDNVRTDHPALSYDGSAVIFTSSAPALGGKKGVTDVFLYERATNATKRITDIDSTYSAGEFVAISRTGAYVAFGCESILDPRFPNTSGYGGLYALFTNRDAAFAWPRGAGAGH